MATLSRRTLGVATRKIADWDRARIVHFFYEYDVPDQLVTGSSKIAMVLNVFKGLEEAEQYDKLFELVQAALPMMYTEDIRRELEAALLRDGFAVVDGTLAEADPETTEQRTAVEGLILKYQGDLNVGTLLHHLTESIDLFRQERWDSSVAHCRNFVEQLLEDIGRCIAQARNETPDLSRPVRVRQYLQDVGFFDQAERQKLVDGVYGYFSEEGSHPGISTQSAARVANAILASFAFYILEKFEAWKTGELTFQ